MLNHVEQRILELLRQRHLVTLSEIGSVFRKEATNNGDASIQRLKNMGYVDQVESLGTCLVITQKGIRALKEKGF